MLTTEVDRSPAPRAKATILTNAPGRPGYFWGDHSTCVGSFHPPHWLASLIGRGRGYDVMGLVSAVQLLARRRHHPGVVTDGGSSGLAFACIQAMVPWGRKPHVMIDCLWYESESGLRRWLKGAVRRLAARSCVRFVVWAAHEVEDFAHAFGVPTDRFVYIPHYFSLDGYEFTIGDDGYVFAGGNGDRDYATLIEAVRPLEVPTWIATTNREAVRRIEVPAHVRIEGTTHAGFRQTMAAARVVVVPMQGGLLHSGGQQTCLNAMVMGKPTIAVGRRWAVDLIEHGDDGLIVDYGDVEGLRSCIAWVLGHPVEAGDMGRRARDKAQHFTSRAAMATIVGLIMNP